MAPNTRHMPTGGRHTAQRANNNDKKSYEKVSGSVGLASRAELFRRGHVGRFTLLHGVCFRLLSCIPLI